MDVSSIPALLESAWDVRHEIVFCFLSNPGVGKTEQIYAFSQWIRKNTEYKESKVVEIIASQILPNEVSGITMPNNDTKAMEVYDHVRLGRLQDGDILFFDELLQGSPQVLSACLTLIQERRMMSGRKLPDIMIVAAANPTVTPSLIPAAIRNRFMFLKVGFDYELWSDYMLEKHGVTVATEFRTILNRTPSSKTLEWNDITPRSMTKLILWCMSIEGDMRKYAFQTISNMYSNEVRDAVYATINITQKKGKEKTDEELIEDIKHSLRIYASDAITNAFDTQKIMRNIDDINDANGLWSLIASLQDPDEVKEYLDGLTMNIYREESDV